MTLWAAELPLRRLRRGGRPREARAAGASPHASSHREVGSRARQALDGEVKAFAHLDREHVLAQARALDERRIQGHPLGPLHGIPVAAEY